MGQPEGMYIPITLKDVYLQQQELMKLVDQLQASINTANATNAAMHVGQEREMAAANTRHESLQRELNELKKDVIRIDKQPVVRPQAMWTGAGVIAAFISLVVGAVTSVIRP